MSTKPTRPARFSRFERVKIIGDVPHWENLHGRAGTVIWSDYWVRPHPSEGEWLHVVYVPSVQRYPTVRESLLESRGGLDPEDDHRGSRFEISYDLVMDEDMPFVEGTFRCPGGFWEVFIFTKGDRDDLS